MNKRTHESVTPAFGSEPTQFHYRLFIAGASDLSLRTVHRLKALLHARAKDQYRLEVIDILQQPELATEHRILATPTLIRLCPRPCRFIGHSFADDPLLGEI